MIRRAVGPTPLASASAGTLVKDVNCNHDVVHRQRTERQHDLLVLGISAGPSGSATLDSSDIRYASTALNVATDAAGVELHGSVVTSTFGVAAGDKLRGCE
jgi:hypothetical protein